MSPSVPPTGSAEELKQVEAATSTVPVQLELLHSYCTTSAHLLYYCGTADVLLWHCHCTPTITGGALAQLRQLGEK